MDESGSMLNFGFGMNFESFILKLRNWFLVFQKSGLDRYLQHNPAWDWEASRWHDYVQEVTQDLEQQGNQAEM